MATAATTQAPSAEAMLERLTGRLFASASEAATILGYDKRTLYASLESGEIPSTRAGRTWRIPVAWLRAQAHK